MADREKVLKGLAFHLKELTIGKTCFDCPYCRDNPCEIQLIADTIALLKEQEAVVRCKDCEMNNQCSIQFKFADPDDPEEWYCANGKRKEADPDA